MNPVVVIDAARMYYVRYIDPRVSVRARRASQLSRVALQAEELLTAALVEEVRLTPLGETPALAA
jgi:hypothetical protein